MELPGAAVYHLSKINFSLCYAPSIQPVGFCASNFEFLGGRLMDRTPAYISRHVVQLMDGQKHSAQPIESFRDLEAYVLLGEPGAGKSVLFRQEAIALGMGARYLTVRDFLRSDIDEADRGRILFIDAMDEQRASDGRVDQPLDRLIAKLKQLGRPRFRLSCRASDWDRLDTQELECVSSDGRVIALQLQPLSDTEAAQLLQGWVPGLLSDPETFIARAREQGLESMLGNPLLLELLARSVSGDAWPASRTEIFRLACQRLAEEHNRVHERAAPAASIDELLDDAGLLCAVLLLSDCAAYRVLGSASGSIVTRDLTGRLGISPDRIKRALNTPLFIAIGDERNYRHRAIAEYLAARAMVKRIGEGLPVTRILALMGGAGGGVVDALRGLYAWLVSFYRHPELLIGHDVLAVIYYGDVRDFTAETKRLVFETILHEAQALPGVGRKDWTSKAFGALGTSDMESYFANVLVAKRFEDADEVLLLSVLEALLHGSSMTGLLPSVLAVVKEHQHWELVRQAALDVLVRHSDSHGPVLLSLLDAIRKGEVEDADDELAGRLLDALYPSLLTTRSLVEIHLRPPRRDDFLGSYRQFWQLKLMTKVPAPDSAVLADAVSELAANGAEWRDPYVFNDVYYGSILHAANTLGAALTGKQLYRWIAAGLDPHGYRKREGHLIDELSRWLVAHPEHLKSVFEYGLVQLDSQGKQSQFFGWQHILLHHMAVPDGWYAWLLEVASRRTEHAIVRHCFGMAAFAAASVPDRFPRGLDLVYAWLLANGERWPEASEWQSTETTLKLDDWRREDRLYTAQRAKQLASVQAERRQALATDLDTILAGGVVPSLMHDLLVVMERGGYGIEGETPLLRVQSYLGCDAATAQQAMDALFNVLDTEKLPSWTATIELNGKGEYFLVQPVCLYAAAQKWGGEDTASGICDYPGAQTLLVFSLLDGRKPIWLKALAAARTNEVAVVLKTFLSQALQRGDARARAVLWLDDFPLRSNATTDVLHSLLTQITVPFGEEFTAGPKGAVLQAAIKHAAAPELAKWVASVLSASELTETEKTVALTASLAYSDVHLDQLLALIVGDPERAQVCCAVFDTPISRDVLNRLAISHLGQFVEQLARLVKPLSEHGNRARLDASIRSGVATLLAELASRDNAAAPLELAKLRGIPELKPWIYQLSDYQIQCEKRLRDAAFGLIDPLAVAEVLSNREPATAHDLVAYVLDQTDTLMRRIRFGGTNMLGIFWRENKTGQWVPQVENDCRDRFLDLLRIEVKAMSIHIAKEQPTARDKRSDMAITLSRPGRYISVPIEVKLDSHANVWGAWNTQLSDLYVPDPDSGGLGVYLVIFTGHKTRLAPGKKRPASAEVMARIFTELIPPSYVDRLYGLVLDVSRIEG